MFIPLHHQGKATLIRESAYFPNGAGAYRRPSWERTEMPNNFRFEDLFANNGDLIVRSRP